MELSLSKSIVRWSVREMFVDCSVFKIDRSPTLEQQSSYKKGREKVCAYVCIYMYAHRRKSVQEILSKYGWLQQQK